MGGGSLAGLQEHLKLARDYALEGLYDTSIIFFDGALAQINKYPSSSLFVPSIFRVKFSFFSLHKLSWVSIVFLFPHNPLLLYIFFFFFFFLNFFYAREIL